MRKQSKNRCYSPDIENMVGSLHYMQTYPKTNSYVEFVDRLTINKLDEFSGTTTATVYGNYRSIISKENDDEALYATVDPIDLIMSINDKTNALIKALKTQIDCDKAYKYNYELLCKYLSGEICTIKLYCKGLAAEKTEYDHPIHGRYIIVVTGYDKENKCKIDYEVITLHNYVMHPSRIINDINNKVKSQNLTVEIDEESFNSAIELLNNNNPLSKEKFTQEELLKSLELLDKASK